MRPRRLATPRTCDGAWGTRVISETRITSRTWVTGMPNSSRSSANVRRWSSGPGADVASAAARASMASANPSSASRVRALSTGTSTSFEDADRVENAGYPAVAQDRGARDHVGPAERGVQALHHDVLVADQPVHQEPTALASRFHHHVEAPRHRAGPGAEHHAAVGHVDEIPAPLRHAAVIDLADRLRLRPNGLGHVRQWHRVPLLVDLD